MASTITFNGVSYSVPAEGDFSWGPDLTAYFIAIASGALQKTGGAFTLTAEADFGATFGLKSTYYKSRHANPAAAGQVRLGNTESLSWRNAANSADLALSANASNNLLFNSRTVLFSAETSIVNADVSASAAIAYSKLNLTGLVVNADLAAAAAIAYSKLAVLTVSRALQTNAATGFIEVSAVTNTELGYLSGVTSAIQTQVNTRQLRSVLTAKGDLYVATASDTVARQAAGADDTTLFADSSQANGMNYHSVVEGDLIYNLSIAASVASNALTIALKTAAGADASATDPIKVAFRSATLATGTVSLVKVTAALSTVISSGSTAGHLATIENPVYVGTLNNAGTAEICWSSTPWDENERITTVAEGGAGAADSATVIYSTTARTNVASRIVARLLSTQTTAGTWAAVPTANAAGSAAKVRGFMPPTVQRFTSGSGTYTLPVSPRKPLYIQVEMVGGGGGGGGSGSTNGAIAGAGGNTTFGSSLLTTNGGALGVTGNAGGTGGTGGSATVSAPASSIVSITGGTAQGGSGNSGTSNAALAGGIGGTSAYGGGGGGLAGAAGTAGVTNTGGGGGGGGAPNTVSVTSGGGGGAGAFIKAIIINPSATYAYAVGAAGSAGGAGTGGLVGAVGGSGVVIVTEFYQ